MYCDLRRWDEAKKQAKAGGLDINHIILNQANEARATGDTQAASSLFVSIRAYRKAIEMMIERKDSEGVLEICRLIDKEGNPEELALCGEYFKGQKMHAQAKEAYLKLDDPKALI
jgi:intraflagellar transport protein 122